MSKVLHDNEHYLVVLSDNPRESNGVKMHYELFCKTSGVTEGFAQMLPQAIDIVEDLNKNLIAIDRELKNNKVINIKSVN